MVNLLEGASGRTLKGSSGPEPFTYVDDPKPHVRNADDDLRAVADAVPVVAVVHVSPRRGMPLESATDELVLGPNLSLPAYLAREHTGDYGSIKPSTDASDDDATSCVLATLLQVTPFDHAPSTPCTDTGGLVRRTDAFGSVLARVPRRTVPRSHWPYYARFIADLGVNRLSLPVEDVREMAHAAGWEDIGDYELGLASSHSLHPADDLGKALDKASTRYETLAKREASIKRAAEQKANELVTICPFKDYAMALLRVRGERLGELETYLPSTFVKDANTGDKYLLGKVAEGIDFPEVDLSAASYDAIGEKVATAPLLCASDKTITVKRKELALFSTNIPANDMVMRFVAIGRDAMALDRSPIPQENALAFRSPIGAERLATYRELINEWVGHARPDAGMCKLAVAAARGFSTKEEPLSKSAVASVIKQTVLAQNSLWERLLDHVYSGDLCAFEPGSLLVAAEEIPLAPIEPADEDVISDVVKGLTADQYTQDEIGELLAKAGIVPSSSKVLVALAKVMNSKSYFKVQVSQDGQRKRMWVRKEAA